MWKPTLGPPGVVTHEVESRVVFGFEHVECDANDCVVCRADQHDSSKDNRRPRGDACWWASGDEVSAPANPMGNEQRQRQTHRRADRRRLS